MATVDVTKIGGGKAGSAELDPVVFETVVKPHLFHAEVRRQLAGRRAGTHATKNRAAVSGGGAKPYRQKGTGRARQGTIRAPQFAGGGSVFGPVPRGYSHKLTKKTRRAALRCALSLRQQEAAVTVVDAFDPGEFKTRRVVESLEGLGLAGSSVLIVIQEATPHLELSARNLPGVGVIRAEGLNVHDVLRHEKLVIVQAALDGIHGRLGAGGEAQA
ncbi:MAG: 50S ribosomal protein L4 [bacterium]|nr:50S ribosomal protein L4 [bacterium]